MDWILGGLITIGITLAGGTMVWWSVTLVGWTLNAVERRRSR